MTPTEVDYSLNLTNWKDSRDFRGLRAASNETELVLVSMDGAEALWPARTPSN